MVRKDKEVSSRRRSWFEEKISSLYVCDAAVFLGGELNERNELRLKMLIGTKCAKQQNVLLQFVLLFDAEAY